MLLQMYLGKNQFFYKIVNILGTTTLNVKVWGGSKNSNHFGFEQAKPNRYIPLPFPLKKKFPSLLRRSHHHLGKRAHSRSLSSS